MKIKYILKRHHYGCFDVEDTEGNCWLIQLDANLERMWKKAKKDVGASK